MVASGIQPSEADISSVCEIAGLDRAQAAIILRVISFSVLGATHQLTNAQKWPGWQNAVTHYFENPADALQEEVGWRHSGDGLKDRVVDML